MGLYSMGQRATFFRLRYVVYCPSLGSSARPVFIHRLSQIACMLRPSIEEGIWGSSSIGRITRDESHTGCKATAFDSRLSRERIELDRGSGGHQFESCTVAVGSPRKQRARQKALPARNHLVLLARVR